MEVGPDPEGLPPDTSLAVCHLLSIISPWASLMGQMGKNLPAMQETWIQSLGWEDPLEKGMATHSSILAYRIPQTEEPDGVIHGVVKNQIRLSD